MAHRPAEVTSGLRAALPFPPLLVPIPEDTPAHWQGARKDSAIVLGMTAEAVNPFDASPVPVLPPDTAPAAIRDALIGEERAEFESAYREALAEAAETLDLTRVLDVLRNYHRIAWLTQRQGPEAHRRMLDKAAEIMRTGQNPDAVPIEDVKALISQRLGR